MFSLWFMSSFYTLPKQTDLRKVLFVVRFTFVIDDVGGRRNFEAAFLPLVILAT